MNSSCIALAVAFVIGTAAHGAGAQPAAQGFAFERFSPSPAGAGWLVLDDLNIHDELGGALELTVNYEHNPVHVSDGVTSLDVVSDKAFANIGGSISFARWRFSLDFDTVFAESGESGTIDAYVFTAPSINPSSHPDTIEDIRVGVDRLVLGKPGEPLRIGASAQLYIPNDNRENYTTDRNFRGMVRALVAGDVGRFAYAAQLGAHIRPLDEGPVPDAPRGSELLFGVAAGARIRCDCSTWLAIIGPEVYGATAFRSMFDADATAIEGLASARIEQTTGAGRRVRIKLGIGGGLVHDFGAAEFRVVAGLEIFGDSVRTSPPHNAAVSERR